MPWLPLPLAVWSLLPVPSPATACPPVVPLLEPLLPELPPLVVLLPVLRTAPLLCPASELNDPPPEAQPPRARITAAVIAKVLCCACITTLPFVLTC